MYIIKFDYKTHIVVGLANNKINESLIIFVSDSLSSVLEIRALSVEEWLITRFKLSIVT